MHALTDKVGKIETVQTAQAKQLNKLTGKVNRLEEKVDRLEDKIDHDVIPKINSLEKKIDRDVVPYVKLLDEDYSNIGRRVSALEKAN